MAVWVCGMVPLRLENNGTHCAHSRSQVPILPTSRGSCELGQGSWAGPRYTDTGPQLSSAPRELSPVPTLSSQGKCWRESIALSRLPQLASRMADFLQGGSYNLKPLKINGKKTTPLHTNFLISYSGKSKYFSKYFLDIRGKKTNDR